MLFSKSEKSQYMYKYMIGFLFLNFAVYSDIHYCLSDKLINYFKYIRFIALIVIIFMFTLDVSSGILLAISFVLFSNIIQVKKYLREQFTNPQNKPLTITREEAYKIQSDCINKGWKGDICTFAMNSVKDACISKSPEGPPFKDVMVGNFNVRCNYLHETFPK